MPKKSYTVDVHLDIHTIKCPGVWLCPKGHVSLGLKLFKAKEKTRQLHPHFPLIINQRFHFRKIFNGLHSYSHLNKILASSFIKAELVQTPTTTHDNIVLAKFKASLMEVVNPEETMCEVDFLFAATDCFPGIISPKAEVSSSVVMEEFVALSSNIEDIPVTIASKDYDKKYKKIPQRQKKVCHSKAYPCSCYRDTHHYTEACQQFRNRQDENDVIDSFPSSSDSKQEYYISYKCSPSLLSEPVVNSFLVNELPSAYHKKDYRRSLSPKRSEDINEAVSQECSCALCQRYEMYIQEQMKEEMHGKEPNNYYMSLEEIGKKHSGTKMRRGPTQPSVVIKKCVSKRRGGRAPRNKPRSMTGARNPLPTFSPYNNNYSRGQTNKNPNGISRPLMRHENSSPSYKRAQMKGANNGELKGCPFLLVNCNCGGKEMNKRKVISQPQLGKGHPSGGKGKWVSGKSKEQRSHILHIKPQKRISRRRSIKPHPYNAGMFEEEEPCKLLLSDNERRCDCNNSQHCKKHNCRKYAKEWDDLRVGGPSNGIDGRGISMCGQCITPSSKSKKKKMRQRWAIPNSTTIRNATPTIHVNCDCHKINRGEQCKCMEYSL